MRLFLFACVNALTFSAAMHFFGVAGVALVTVAYLTGFYQGRE